MAVSSPKGGGDWMQDIAIAANNYEDELEGIVREPAPAPHSSRGNQAAGFGDSSRGNQAAGL
eukprot:649316-Pyramimonas_sp.AAC.1